MLQNAPTDHLRRVNGGQGAHLFKHLLGHPLGRWHGLMQGHAAHDQVFEFRMVLVQKQRDLLAVNLPPNEQPPIRRACDRDEKHQHRHNRGHALDKPHCRARADQRAQKHHAENQTTAQPLPARKLPGHVSDRVFQFEGKKRSHVEYPLRDAKKCSAKASANNSAMA